MTLLDMFCVVTALATGLGLMMWVLRDGGDNHFFSFYAFSISLLCIYSSVAVPSKRLLYGSRRDGAWTILETAIMLILLVVLGLSGFFLATSV
ncbi:MAG: hypothetical protein QGG36_06385 [Pirellulaceae bacterium]|jgi:hypothetical protein|nr:hypothetical protein [Pirellulaceae bacterium]MDP7015406.1 hypothetical protein [Pirellulaceae bacterium]